MADRNWITPTTEMSDMKSMSGVTLRAACTALNLPTSGPKHHLAGRLLDAGLTATQVKDRYGWQARSEATADTPPEVRVWEMFALPHDGGGSPQFYGIGPFHYAHAHGGTPVPVVVTEDPDGDMLGWIETGDNTPVMIQHKRIFDIQFPYSWKAEADLGRGNAVPLRVELATARPDHPAGESDE